MATNDTPNGPNSLINLDVLAKQPTWLKWLFPSLFTFISFIIGAVWIAAIRYGELVQRVNGFEKNMADQKELLMKNDAFLEKQLEDFKKDFNQLESKVEKQKPGN